MANAEASGDDELEVEDEGAAAEGVGHPSDEVGGIDGRTSGGKSVTGTGVGEGAIGAGRAAGKLQAGGD